MPETCFRGGAAPEKAELGLPGADSKGAEVWKHLHGTRDPQVALAKLGEVWSGGFVGGGGVERWNTAGARRAGNQRVLWPTGSSAKEAGS